MITSATNEKLYEFRGLSTDTKPVDATKISNGSIFFEMDTAKVFVFIVPNDPEAVAFWHEI